MSYKAHPIDGFRQDFDKFHMDFLAAKSLRFRVFAEVWRKRKFSFMLYGRETLLKTHDFIECLFYQLLDYTQPPHEIETQVCAFYMLYGFYFKQPMKGRIRIRVTNKEWSFILKLEAAMRREGHWDLVYVFHALCSAKAFHFCATRQPYFPNAPIYAFLSDDHLQLSSGKPLSAILGVERLQMLENIHERYQAFKEAISTPQSTPQQTSEYTGERSNATLTSDLNLVRPNYFTNLMEKVRKDDDYLKSVEQRYRSQLSSQRKRKVCQMSEQVEVSAHEDTQEEEEADSSDDQDEETSVETEDDAEEREEILQTEEPLDQPSSSTANGSEDEHWRNRSRRSSMLQAKAKISAAAEAETSDLTGLSIGERRRMLKEGHYYGLSPTRPRVRPKRQKKSLEEREGTN